MGILKICVHVVSTWEPKKLNKIPKILLETTLWRPPTKPIKRRGCSGCDGYCHKDQAAQLRGEAPEWQAYLDASSHCTPSPALVWEMISQMGLYAFTVTSTYVNKTLVVHSVNVLWQGRVFLNHLGLGKPSQKCFPCSSKSAVLCVKCIGRKKLW